MNSIRKISKALFGGTLILLLVFIFVSQVAAQTCVLPPAGLVSWWPGDGDAVDIVGGNDGTLSGDVTFATGFVTSGNGQAFSFVRGNLATPLVVSYATGTTFDAWIKTTTNTAGMIMSGGGGSSIESGLGMFTNSTGDLIYTGSKGDGIHNFAVGDFLANDGVFHHVAGTWTGDTTVDGVKLYVDGSLVAEGTALVGIATDSTPLNIGGHTTLGFQKFAGIIDEVEVFNRVLSASEIKGIYDAGSAGKCKTVVILGAEVDSKNNTLLISGVNFGSTGVFSGVVRLFVPTQGDVTLNVLNFDPVAQEILTELPVGVVDTPGTFRLVVTKGSEADDFDVTIVVGAKSKK